MACVLGVISDSFYHEREGKLRSDSWHTADCDVLENGDRGKLKRMGADNCAWGVFESG